MASDECISHQVARTTSDKKGKAMEEATEAPREDGMLDDGVDEAQEESATRNISMRKR